MLDDCVKMSHRCEQVNHLYLYHDLLYHTVILGVSSGLFLCRVPLASRAYIKTAGLRSTIAWAMASLAEIKVRKIFAFLLIASSFA